MNKNNYYKVVRVVNNKLYSVNGSLGKVEVEYKLGEWVTPKVKNSKLFIFNTRQTARSFKKIEEEHNLYLDIQNIFHIYKIEVENPSYR
jgi:hypothetical protein